MGGFGSGRRSRTPAVEECIVLTMANLKAWGMLRQHCMCRDVREWRYRDSITARLTITTDINCLEQHPCIKIEGTAYGKAKGTTRTPEKRAFLARIAKRAFAAGREPVRAYY